MLGFAPCSPELYSLFLPLKAEPESRPPVSKTYRSSTYRASGVIRQSQRVARRLHREGRYFAWENADLHTSALCLPAIGLALAVPLLHGNPGTAVLMGAGTVSVGFGAFQEPLFFRGAPMFAAALGIALSATIGATIGQHALLLAAVAVLWSFLYGLSDAINPATAYVGLQCCIFLVISAAIPQPFAAALLRGEGIFAGGMLQAIVMMLLWLFLRGSAAPGTHTADARSFQIKLRSLVRHTLQHNTLTLRYAIRLAITAGIAETVAYHLHFRNGYWVPMTALIILKPQFKDTTQRAASRMLGTLAGGVLATLLTVLLRPNGALIVVLVLVCVGASYVLLNVNYAAYSIALTAYVAFVLAINRMPEQQTVTRRIIATSLGGAIGFGVHLATLWMKPQPEQSPPLSRRV